MPSSWSSRRKRIVAKLGLEREWHLVAMAAAIGLVMGGVATAFILPIRAIERWAESADFSLLLWLVPVAPVIGALLASVAMRAAKGHESVPGISSVIYSIHRQKSRIPLSVAARKWIASTLTIASGGSAGAEGPIATIGSAIGSWVARLARIDPQNVGTMLGCGAAAGIASVFNAPIAGIFFVLEILLRDFSLRTFTPIVIASVVSAAWTRTILGEMDPLFLVAPDFFREGYQFTMIDIPAYLVLGVVCGLVAVAFIRGLIITESLFDRLKAPSLLKPGIGAAMLGVLGVAFLLLFKGQPGGYESVPALPPFYGNGYPVIKMLLSPSFYADRNPFADSALGIAGIVLAIVALKGVATCLTIGSGGSGGLFAPSLLLGAAVGGCLGQIVNMLGVYPAASPAHFALVGMAAMVAATAHAPLTGILIVYEVTLKYELILPLMLTAVISTVVGRLLYRDSVYTFKLTQMGVRIGAMSDLTFLRRLSVQDVPLAAPVLVRMDESAQRLLELSERHLVRDFVVVDNQERYAGMVTGDDLSAALVYREAVPLLQVRDLQRSDLPTVTTDESLDVVLDKFSRHDVQSLAVLDTSNNARVRGMITRARLMQRYQAALAMD
jgi:CIC family chloride channel protein